ncbi:hypothetical protein [Microbispora sp. CA-102843]|uniref:hypothetical protein n=1 Tax=Microbispora sp. CA-102843 TaxID=3239952 RepID=UPI003D8FB5D1
MRPAPLAALGAVLSVVVGGLVNVLTASWSWRVFVVAAGLLVVVAVIAYRMESTKKQDSTSMTRTSQVASGAGARIATSPISANSADVDQAAENHGQIMNSRIIAENAAIRQRATEGGIIEDSGITAQ